MICMCEKMFSIRSNLAKHFGVVHRLVDKLLHVNNEQKCVPPVRVADLELMTVSPNVDITEVITETKNENI